MKLKVSTSPYTYFLLLMTIMDTGYLVLLNIPGLRDTGYMRIGFLLIATLVAMNCYINKNIYRTLQPYYNYLNVFILYLVVFYLAHFIYGMVHYTQQITSIINVSNYLGMFLLIYLFLYVFQMDGGYDRLIKSLSWITYPYMLVITLRAAIYNFTGQDLMPYLGHALRTPALRHSCPVRCAISLLFLQTAAKRHPDETQDDLYRAVAFYRFLPLLYLYDPYVCDCLFSVGTGDLPVQKATEKQADRDGLRGDHLAGSAVLFLVSWPHLQRRPENMAAPLWPGNILPGTSPAWQRTSPSSVWAFSHPSGMKTS